METSAHLLNKLRFPATFLLTSISFVKQYQYVIMRKLACSVKTPGLDEETLNSISQGQQ